MTTAFRAILITIASSMIASRAHAASKDLGNGFTDHGVTVPISNGRGTVATVDGNGRNVALMWLMDHRGGYSLLLIDAQTGKAEQFAMPFPPAGESVDSPYASILSSGNKFYTLIHSHFAEFDPATRAFTFCSRQTTPRFAMGMTEDDNGVIWAATYPQTGIVSFNPKTREFHDYGECYKQNWPEYPSFVAADESGWIYVGLGFTASQILAFDPASGKAAPLLAADQRREGQAYVYRDMDGKVYGQALRDKGDQWLELDRGIAKPITTHAKHPKPIVTGNQTLFHADFPDGSKLKRCDPVNRTIVIQQADGKGEKEFSFDYQSDGAVIESVLASPDGTICGGTSFPMRFYSFDPKSDKMIDRPAYGQWNTVARQGDHFFAGGYPGGFLLDWDPSKPWHNTEKNNAASNPLFLTQLESVYRPDRLTPYSDGKTIIMGGTPQYGHTGGGLLFWDREKHTATSLAESDLISNQSTMSLLPLSDGKLLGGTTTAAGTGGEKKATEAELYIMDFASHKIDWHAPLIPGAQDYLDLCEAPDGLVYGMADRRIFFVFDPTKRAIVSKRDTESDLGLTGQQQGTRVLIQVPGDSTYILVNKGIVRIDPKTHDLKLITQSPVIIEGSGDYLDRRIYFLNASHLYSYRLSK